LARGFFDAFQIALSVMAVTYVAGAHHPFRALMLASLAGWILWGMMDLLWQLQPALAWPLAALSFLSEAMAVTFLVIVAVRQVTQELTNIALELRTTTGHLEQSNLALRQIHAASATLLRAGSIKACLTALLDLVALQLGFKSAIIFLLNPASGRWESYKHSPITGQALKGHDLPVARKTFLTEVILSGQPAAFGGGTAGRIDQDFLNLTGFSKRLAVVPLSAPRVSYSPHGEAGKGAHMQRGSAWKAEPCWIADRVCMLGLGNFPQRLNTCKTCHAFEPLGAIAIDLRHVPDDVAASLELLTSLGLHASLALRDLMQIEELVTDIRFRTAALDPLPLGIVLLGPDGRITAINRVVRQIAGPKAATWIGSPIGDVPLTTRPELLHKLVEDILRHPTEEGSEFSTEMVGPQGLRQCVLRVQALLRNQVLTGILITVDDVTETRELQRAVVQQERFSAMGQLAMGIAHEVNNPIAGVSGLLQMLAKRLPAEASEQRPIQTAINDLKRASTTIRNLLQFSRPKPASLQMVDLNRLINEVVELQMFHPLAGQIVIHKDLADDLPFAKTDRDSIAQVLTNLCLNALQAMDGVGEITIDSWATGKHLIVG
ncbi:MAG: histidine kinase dimerization/phospho-acceptor domain-containing protein, partial [bacterium]